MSTATTENTKDKFADLIGPMDPKLDKEVREKLITARVGLLLRASFFGNLATRLKLVNADEWCGTAATHGRNFYYNSRFINMLRPKEIEFLFSGNDNGNAERLIIKSTSSELSLRCTDGRYPNIMDVMVKEYSKELVYDANTVQSQYDSILKQSGKRPSDFKCTFEISENNELTIFNGKEDDRITKPITSAIIKDLPNFVNVDFDKPIWAIASLNKGSMEVYKKLDASIYNAQIRINNKGIFVQCYIDLSSLVKQFKPVKIKGTKQGNLNTETTENKFKELLDFCELMLDGDLTQEEINKFSNLADLCEVMIER